MIKKFFNPGVYPTNINIALLLIRIGAGALMLTHGMSKITLLFGNDPIQFADPIGLGATTSLLLAILAEVFCSVLLILGLGTRFAAAPLIITMLVAAFVFHANDPFSKQELPLLYTASFMVIAIAGAGRISLDNWIYKSLHCKRNEVNNKIAS